jgi:hypothetical protein
VRESEIDIQATVSLIYSTDDYRRMKRFSCFVFAHGMNCLAASSSAAAAA